MLTKILITYLVLSNFLYAATDFNHPLTLSELISIALENHPTTRQAWWNANRAASILGSAKSAYYPEIDLELSVINGRDFQFINGPEAEYTIFGADFILSMILYDFGERKAAVNSAKMALLAANWEVDWTIQKVMIQVLTSAYQVLHEQEAVLAATISLEDAQRMLEAARELNRAGLSPISDVYTSEAILAQMKMSLTQKKAELDIQRGKLATSIGVSADTPIELAALNPVQFPCTQEIETLISIAYRQRTDLMAKQAKLSESNFNLEKAQTGYWPRISLSGTGGYNYAVSDKANGAQYQIGLYVDTPLFDGFNTLYKNRIAYADTQLSMEQLADLQLNIAFEVLTQSRLLKASQEMLDDAKENLRNSTKAYEGVLEKYRVGKERMAEVSSAQKQLANARVLYSDVKTRWLVSLANLAYSTGTLFPDMEKRCHN